MLKGEILLLLHVFCDIGKFKSRGLLRGSRARLKKKKFWNSRKCVVRPMIRDSAERGKRKKKRKEKLVISALAAQCGKVWLTVSSLWRPIAASDKVVDAELEVNWDLDCPSSTGYPDTIKVFTADPAHSNKFCLLLLNS